MKNCIKTLALGIFMTVCATAANAQLKIAHIHADSLVLLMPEAKKADSTIKTETDKWENALAQKEAKLKVMYDSIMTIINLNGGKEPNDPFFQLMVEDYQEGSQKLQRNQQEAQNAIGLKRQVVYEPIIAKVRKAIEEVAKEKGYTYVLDSGAGGILYSQPADNIMADVKKKLGLK